MSNVRAHKQAQPNKKEQPARALEVKQLLKQFGDFKAVNEISFDVYEQEIFGFLGANGAGKSTAIRMICGILPPTAGSMQLLEYDVKKEPHKVKASIGYMSQKFSLYADLTVAENIELFAGIHGIEKDEFEKRKQEALKLADLEGSENKITASLPAGIKQKLALATALIHHPPVIFLDEPTAGVDPASRRMFWEVINDLRDKGATVFVTSHYMDEVEQCDRIALMHRGNIVALDSPENLKRDIIKGHIIYVESEDFQTMRENLLEIDEVERADPMGRGLHVMTRDRRKKATTYINSFKKKLKQAGIEVKEIESRQPSLEDVFVYLIGSLEEKGGQT